MLAVINPVSRHGKGYERARETIPLFSDVFSVKSVESEGKGHIERLVQELGPEFDCVLVCGGDGSVHEAVNGLMKVKNPKPVVAYLPTGSGNDSARSCGIPFNLKKAVEVIKRFKTEKIDVGVMNDRFYSNSLGIGLDGLVAHKVFEMRGKTRLKGVPLYIKSLFEVLREWEPFTLKFIANGSVVYEHRAMLSAVNIGRSYGGGFFVTPDAWINDGLLDVCIVDEIPKWQVPLRLPFFVLGKYRFMKVAKTMRVDKVEIHASRTVFAQLDGETYQVNTANVSIIPGVIEAVVSERAYVIKR
jgi:YegS/Rv2252/BmrU family lipid kinase